MTSYNHKTILTTEVMQAIRRMYRHTKLHTSLFKQARVGNVVHVPHDITVTARRCRCRSATSAATAVIVATAGTAATAAVDRNPQDRSLRHGRKTVFPPSQGVPVLG